jgi:hypothetical protein
MRRVLAIGVVVVILLPGGAVHGQAIGTVVLPKGTVGPCYPAHGAHRILVEGDRLRKAFDLVMERSPTFAAAVAAVEAGGSMRVRIGYRHQLLDAYERLSSEDRVGAAFLADSRLFNPPGTILCEVRVVFFTAPLEERLVQAGIAEEDVILDLALVLVHEVYGHLIPFTEQVVPVWPTPCRDPGLRQAASATGCAVDRENAVRRELGVPERRSYAHVDGPLVCALPAQSCIAP